jgi:hypothetical protein
MKKLSLMIAGLFLWVSAALGAGIDGKWTAEMKMGGRRNADAKTQAITMDLKASGDKLEGSVSAGRKGAGVTIQDGKIEGNKFSFTTVVASKKKGDQKIRWEGTVEGDTLKGTRGVEGAKRAQDFTAKRS